ncbi:class I SAM-dependent methyltransferase [Nonomuraea sp. NPDC050691]|uniref:class I SAM-dependent methyltransferase n=1 Tax=Nonomuraea sp. NPDC050691 TaxID=3155661 RepID=UPI0033E405D4
MTDFISFPFYDLIHEDGQIPAIREKLPPLLAGVSRSILEIGAGSGLITKSLAEWTPAEIFALEPSAGMRGMLLTRLSRSQELLERVTVLPYDALSLDLDEPVEAMVMINVMYALEPDYRRRLWPVLASRLEAGGLLVFTWQPGGAPRPGPLPEIPPRRVGRHTYKVSGEILESDGESCKARYLYEVVQGDKVIDEEEIVGHAYRPVWETIQEELVGAGFVQADAPDGLLAWRLP